MDDSPNTISTAIIDDEPIARKRIVHLLSRHEEFKIIGQYDSGQSAYDGILESQPDVIFLDIEIPDFSGVELLKKVSPEARPITVFVTAYDAYAIDAFDLFAIDYLLKPFTQKRFDQTISRIKEKVRDKRGNQLLGYEHSLKQFMSWMSQQLDQPNKKISVLVGKKTYFIQVDDIQYIIADGNYVNLYVRSDKHVIRETMSSLIEKLPSRKFLRIHKSHIINIEFVQELQREKQNNYYILMKDGKLLKISKMYQSSVLTTLLG